MTKPTTRVYRTLILEALAQGEGTSRQITERIGAEAPGGASVLLGWLRTMERQGLVREVRRDRSRGKANNAPIVWALAQTQTEEAA